MTVSWTIHTVLGVPSIFFVKYVGVELNLAIQMFLLVLSSAAFLLWAPYSIMGVWVAIVLESVGKLVNIFFNLMYKANFYGKVIAQCSDH